MWAVGTVYFKERIGEMTSKKGALLDIGCGPGHWSAAAIEAGMTTVGSDITISRGALKVRQLYNQFSLVQANGECLPIMNGSFDIVLCELVLPYVNIEACMKEISRVLKMGGIVHGICHGPGYYLMQGFSEIRRFDRKALRRIAILCYTVIHRVLRLRNYFYETFQTVGQIRKVVVDSGLSLYSVNPGGHPLIRQKQFLGLRTFFEFTAKKAKGLEDT